MKRFENLPPIKYVPLGYSSTLEKVINVKSETKYDILFYGSSCPRRDDLIKDLRNNNMRVYYGAYTLWADQRDKLVGSSKIVLNIHFYPCPILETTRLVYLLANKAFVISEPSLDPILDRDYKDLVKFVEYEKIGETCKYYVEHEEERNAFAQQAYEKFKEKRFEISIQSHIPC